MMRRMTSTVRSSIGISQLARSSTLMRSDWRAAAWATSASDVRALSEALPQADSAAVVEELPEQVDIMITEAGTFLVNGRELINGRPETIRNALQKVTGGNNSLPLTISADANAKHQHVVTAMDIAGRLGFVQISIATVNEPESE